MQRISICIPNYNRSDLLLESFINVYGDERIAEIIISDDHSDIEIYKSLEELFVEMPKVRMERNGKNIDCYANKRRAVSMAKTEFVILFDSDNILKKDYIDKVYEYKWKDDKIITPSFAKPHFDFTAFEGTVVSRENVAKYLEMPMFETMLNAANFFVNRDRYLLVWDDSVDPVTSDSIFFCYNWLKSGNDIFIAPGLHYEHRVHPGSHYKNNVSRTPVGFHQSILSKLKQLK